MPFDPHAYHDPRPQPWLIHAAGVLNRHVLLPRLLRIRRVDLPAADAARLRQALNPATAAFVAPNHPEFCTEWLLDKELAHRASPLMAHWASYGIVNAHPLARRLWLALNLIANAPGGGGRAYSIAAARAGHGVLLHPEGTATWCADRIGPLVPGIATLALEAAAAERRAPSGPGGAPRRVFIVPVVWKLHFTGDVARALDREIRRVARALEIAVPRGAEPEVRFAALHTGLLAARARRFGVPLPAPRPDDFFASQEALAKCLIGRLERRHGAPGDSLQRWLHRVRRDGRALQARDPASARRDLALAHEIERLDRFSAAVHGGGSLTQEQIAESLQQIRTSLLTRGPLNALRHLIPAAVAPRIARVRVPDPIEIPSSGAPPSRDVAVTALHERMQDALARLGDELAPDVDPWRRPNPLAARPRAHGNGSVPARAERARPRHASFVTSIAPLGRGGAPSPRPP